jgi:adenylate cyclase
MFRNLWVGVLGGIYSYLGDAEMAESASLRAVELSPLDPARFLFDVFVAAGKLAAGKHDEVAQAARSSIRLHARRPASHRLLTISLSLAGKVEEARQAAKELLLLDSTFRVSAYAARYAGRNQPHAEQRMKALRDGGLPS